MKNIIITFCISMTFSQHFNPYGLTNSIFLNDEAEEDTTNVSAGLNAPSGLGGNISVMGAFPKGEFKDQEVPSAIGIDFNLLYYLNDYAAIGLNLGGSQYGFTQREIPYNQWTSVGLIEETRNNMGYGNLLLKIIPFKGPVKIYGEGLIGLKNLNTVTKLFSKGNDCDDPDTSVDECEIASDTNASDTAFGYGAGGGIEVVLLDRKDEGLGGVLSLFIAAKYLWGGEVQYLKEGGLTVTPDPEGVDFPTIDYDWNESKTDVMHYNLGLHFVFSSND